MKVTGSHNKSHPGDVTPATAVAWSCRRAWHGEKVKVYLHAELTRKDPTAAVRICKQEPIEDFDSLSGIVLSAYASGCEYEIAWKGKAYLKCREFVLKAKVDETLEADVSAPLYVDLDEPEFSM